MDICLNNHKSYKERGDVFLSEDTTEEEFFDMFTQSMKKGAQRIYLKDVTPSNLLYLIKIGYRFSSFSYVESNFFSVSFETSLSAEKVKKLYVEYIDAVGLREFFTSTYNPSSVENPYRILSVEVVDGTCTIKTDTHQSVLQRMLSLFAVLMSNVPDLVIKKKYEKIIEYLLEHDLTWAAYHTFLQSPLITKMERKSSAKHCKNRGGLDFDLKLHRNELHVHVVKKFNEIFKTNLVPPETVDVLKEINLCLELSPKAT